MRISVIRRQALVQRVCVCVCEIVCVYLCVWDVTIGTSDGCYGERARGNIKSSATAAIFRGADAGKNVERCVAEIVS